MAPGEHVAPNEPVTRRTTLWLSIRLGRKNWLFEVEPDEERAIVVGSLLRAHVRINRHDIAPVHFHFEREQDRIRVCPAYGADLCVNGTRICGPHELDAHAKIEFAGLEVEAYVCDIEPNILEQLDLRDWTAEELPDCGAVLSLPDGAEVTRAIPRLSPAPEVGAGETKKFVPLCDSYLQQAATATARGADEVDVNHENDEPASVTRESILPSPVVSVGAEQLEAEASSSADCEPTLPGVRGVTSVAAPEPRTSDPELSIDDFPSTAPVCSDSVDDATAPPSSLLTRIGLLARERPLRATFAAWCGSALLTLAMLAARNVFLQSVHHELDRQPPSSSPVAPALSQSSAVPGERLEDATDTVPAITFVGPAVSASPRPSATRQRGSGVSTAKAKQLGQGLRNLTAPAKSSVPVIRSGL